MFRKEDALARDWTPEKSHELASIQKELILQAANMLRPGRTNASLFYLHLQVPEEDGKENCVFPSGRKKRYEKL